MRTEVLMEMKSEYERLRQLADAPEGWQLIETAWNAILYHHEKDRMQGAGALVRGFAIDTITKECLLDDDTDNHDRPRQELIRRLVEDGVDLDEAEYRVIKGWGGTILDFGFPCIFIGSPRFMSVPQTRDYRLVDELDVAIIESGVGMPITGMYMRHHEKRMLG